jgi:hypothetical protein
MTETLLITASASRRFISLCLDFAKDNLVLGWGFAFGHLALVTLAGLTVMRYLRD